MDVSDSFAQTFKVCLVGAASVGKTALVNRLTTNVFSSDTLPTVGGGHHSFDCDIAGTKRSLNIWDTAGSEKYRSIAPIYYHDAHAALLVYDITSRSSFDQCEAWYNTVVAHSRFNVTFMLVGNKLDLEANRRILVSEGENFATAHNCVGFFETSACTGHHVTEVFTELARMTSPGAERVLSVVHEKDEPPPQKCC
jgi:small GTP-binding protein